MSFNKNCNNQSGIQADTVQANVSLITPNLSLPTTNDYLNTLTSNNIGYTINGTPNTNNIVSYNTDNAASPYLIRLSVGVWLVCGQIDFYSSGITDLLYTEVSTELVIPTQPSNNKCNKNMINTYVGLGDSIINQVTGIYTITSDNTIVNLLGTITFSDGKPISKIANVTTTATTTTATTSSFTFVISAVNSLIVVGMVISGTGIVGSPIVVNISGTTITLKPQQSISASTVLTFTLTKGSSFLTATRIG
jgi:hypothetical protein